MQTTKITNRTAVNVNLDAEMTGFEVELQWKVQSIPGLTVEFNGSVLDTKYASGTTDINPTNKGIMILAYGSLDVSIVGELWLSQKWDYLLV